MPNLPHNPTQQELKDRYWYEFLQRMKIAEAENDIYDRVTAGANSFEYGFWYWVMREKIGVANDTKL